MPERSRWVTIVPRSEASVTVARNVDGSTASRLTFADVHVPAEQVIATGAEAKKLALQLQDFLVLGAAAELIGLAAAALDVTLDYIKLRQQFGRPIGSFQVLQHRAVNAFIDVELNRSLVYRVLAAYDAGEHHPAMVSAAKARASRSALEIVRCALQMHGAHRLRRGARHRPLLQNAPWRFLRNTAASSATPRGFQS
jgi:alkylation response protein AidB-like acyl-CoA dehydrogenase